MDQDVILLNESENDGKTIYLYFNRDIGFYVAYGLSAFLVTHVVEPLCSFSLERKVPIALLRRFEINELCRTLKKIEHVEQSFYKLELRASLGREGYDRWAEKFTV